MTILIDENTRVLVQGITGKIGAFHTQEMIAYGTNIVGGVTPGKSGTQGPRPAGIRHGQGRRRRHRRDCQHRLRAAALRRRFDHGSGRRRHPGLRRHHRRHPGAGHDPGQALHAPLQGREPHAADGPELCRRDQPRQRLLGIMPGHIYLRGQVGVVGRSGTLGYEAAAQMKELGIGISTSVGIGGDPINGSSFKDVLELFEARSATPTRS